MSSLSQLVERLEQLDRSATSPDTQLDSVLECLSLPIEWLNQVPTLVNQSVWKQHVWHVFKDMVPQWTFALNSSTHKHLVQSTLYLSSLSDSFQVTMARISLPVLLECIATTHQQDVTLETLEMYSSSLRLLMKLTPQYGQYVPRNDVRFFCSLICSIPGHLANAFGIQSVQYGRDLEWYTDRKFYTKLSRQCADHLTGTSLVYTQELLSKIVRQGYEDIVIESIYSSSTRNDIQWANVFEQIEVIASPDQVIRPMLAYAKQTLLPKSNNTIVSVARNVSHLLFGNPSDNDKQPRRKERIQEFLNMAIFRLVQSSWADDKLARLVVTIAILAEGCHGQDNITASAQSMIVNYAKRAIQTWSDPVFLKHGSSREKYYMTAVILTLIAYLDVQDVQISIMMETTLLNSVSQYFASGDAATARIGAVMAEAVSCKTDKEKPLHTTLLDGQDRLVELKGLVLLKDALDKEAVADLSTEAEKSTPEEEDHDRDNLANEDEEADELDPDAAFDTNSQQTDSDKDEDDDEEEFQAYLMEDESEDEGLKKEGSSKKQQKKPVFIRDLIRCLQDRNDPLKLEIGLNAAEHVIRRKTGAGTELSESSVVLAKYIISFPETYEIDNYQTLQRNALVALMTAVPETVCGFVIDEMYNRDTSDGQKQLILGSISLAVRELAGWSTTTTEPAAAPAIANHINTSKQVGTPIFASKKLTLQEPKRYKNRLSGLAGPVFFFPLLVGWWEGTQGLIKYWIGNNALLTERFIMTLNIILHSATNTPDKRKIVKEYFQFISSMKYATVSTHTVSIRKAMLLGIDTIIGVCYSGQEVLLYQDYQNELYDTKQWLENMLEQADEPELHDLTIGIVVKLSQIALTATNALVTQH
ncbi:telomere length regulation protein TEL2 homolog [Mucor ambiguus]|uniref:Telomere length regulation protein TEL2 homolog n=1 Tax=Mucor ambiguus TaxID=91626 RepID=A0A0C9LU58_9FUNG|nr:telomere length regulation protein TEL2 homolog [Mucor ambiguus]